MSSHDHLRESLARKLTKKHLVFHKSSRVASMELPERLKDGDDDEEDVLKPKVDGAARFMNQSVLEMISRAGSNVDVQARIDESSSEDESEAEPERTQKPSAQPSPSTLPLAEPSKRSDLKHARISSKGKLFRSIDKLRVKSSRGSQGVSTVEDPMSSSQILAPPSSEEPTPEAPPDSISADAPILSRKVLAEADIEDSEEEAVSATKQHPSVTTSPKKEPLSLERKLMELFGFEELETIIAEYKCWLLQSVLLDGYLYVTQRHICFYAYLPKKATTVAKSGYFNKRGHRNPRYRRYYFELKGDILTYYESASTIYYPRGKIDLRYGISANITDHKERTYFEVVTEQRTYHFRADSAPSAKQWVKSLQKAIFRSHNDGDIVKISIPLESVIDVEENPIIDFAETVKLRVFDNDETYAIEEYYFSFLNRVKEALRIIRVMVDGRQTRQEAEDRAESEAESDRPEERHSRSLERPSEGALASALRGHVRSTLSPVRPASRAHSTSRMSCDSRRSSHEMQRRSFDQQRKSSQSPRRSLSVRPRDDRSRSPLLPRPQESVSSPTDSHDIDTESSAAIQSLDENNVSASQILDRSDLFRRPTMYESRRSISDTSLNEMRRDSEDTARSARVIRRDLSENGRGLGSVAKARTEGKTRRTDIQQTAVVPETTHGTLPGSLTSIQDIVRAGSYPLQRASLLAGFLRERSKRMSNLVATESMGYYEKVSEMWVGGGRHYNTVEGLAPDDDIRDPEDEDDAASAAQRFRDHFALPETEQLHASFYTYFHRVLPLYGKIYISNKHFCYRTLLPGVRTKLLIPLKDIEGVNKEKGYRPGYCALVIVIKGHEEIFFDFRHKGFRDDCAVTLLLGIEAYKGARKDAVEMFSDDEQEAAEAAKAEHDALLQARKDGLFHHEYLLQRPMSDSDPDAPSLKFDDLKASILNFKPLEPMRITCLTIGSRGDVQPYIALCKRLLEDGHRPKIATHAEFEPWIRSYGIDFAPVAGDPAELMRICVEYGMFTPTFLREVNIHFRGWLDDLLNSAWEACQDAEVLIESPSAMAGIHIAEALKIPYFRAFTMPWTRTRSYPHAFAVPPHKMGGTYNYTTYVIIENLFWSATASQVNSWRKKTLGLKKTDFAQMQQNKVPFLYNFSPHFVIPPLDYSDWIRITGYWFLDEGKDYVPPPDLAYFIKKARDDGKKLVYVGFGSIVVDDPTALTQTVIEAVQKADVRCILSKGWSDRLSKHTEPTDAAKTEVPLPSEIFQIKAAPHDWLFRQIDAAVHHGGAGTTGASLRAGIPTLVKPFFGDQHFSGMRVEDLGVGILLRKLNKSIFAKALWEATHSERMIQRARELGEIIRSEDGVGTAIKALYRDMEYARSLIKHRNRVASEELDEGFEETWTFIGDESDPELVVHRRAHEWDPKQLHGGVRAGGDA